MPFSQSSLGVPPATRAPRFVPPLRDKLPPATGTPSPPRIKRVNRRPSRNSVVVNGVVFTARMWEIIELLADGVPPKKIAERTGVSYATVKVTMFQSYTRARVVHPTLSDRDTAVILIRWAIMRRLGVPISVWLNMGDPNLNTLTFPAALLKETPTDA